MSDERNITNEISGYSNTSNADIDKYYFYETEQFTILSILMVFIVGGNSAVVLSLIRSNSQKNRMNYFIKHLAFTDLSVGLVCVLTDLVWKWTISWEAGNVACKIIKFLQIVVTYASTYVLVALSIDRYDAIRHPMNFTGSWKRARYSISIAWMFSIIFSLPILYFYEEKMVQGRLQCWIEFSDPWKWQIYVVLASTSVFILPALIITSCYTMIILTLWTNSTNINTLMKKNSNRSGSDHSNWVSSSRGLIPKAKVKSIKITLVIVSVFIMCWSPYIIFDLLQVFEYVLPSQTNVAVATFVQSLASLNSAANPIIYFIFSTNICRNIWLLPPFKWTCRGKKINVKHSSTQATSLSDFNTNNTQKKRSVASTSAGHAVLIHTKE